MKLWLVDLLTYPWQARSAWLVPDEIKRACRFRFEDDRRRYRAAHCALREVLGQWFDSDPGSFEFRENQYGKPSVNITADSLLAGCHFNLSHSADLALIGISADVEIGIDIEIVRDVNSLWPLAEQNFTPVERDELRAAPPDERSHTFLRGWTRKEACLKAVGCGLSIAPKSFHTGLSNNPAEVIVETEDGMVQLRVENLDVGLGQVATAAWIVLRHELNHTSTRTNLSSI